MEHVVADIVSKSFSVKADDPYGASHDLLHWCQQFGRVEENRNRVLSSGPRVMSEVDFTLRKALDRFSSVVFKVKMDGHVSMKRLEVIVNASYRAEIPSAQGVLTSVFEEYYRSRIFPALQGTAQKVAEDLVEAMEKRLVPVQLKAL